MLGGATKTGGKLILFDQDLTLILVNFLQDQTFIPKIFPLLCIYIFLFIYIGFLRDDIDAPTSKYYFEGM